MTPTQVPCGIDDLVTYIPLVYIALMIAILGVVVRLLMWTERMNEFKTSTTEVLTEIRADITEIRADIKKMFDRLPSMTVMGGGPLGLTDLGKEIAQKFEAAQWAERIAPTLRNDAKGMQPYEIQDMCAKYVRRDSVFDKSAKARIRESAHENGLKRDQVLEVLMVVLRDRLLALQDE